MASNISTGGIVAGYITAAICIAGGLTIVLNWRDYGLKYFNFSLNYPLKFGNGWWVRRGFKVFRVMFGGGITLLGSAFLIADTVGLLKR
jgi:hypothetical protein